MSGDKAQFTERNLTDAEKHQERLDAYDRYLKFRESLDAKCVEVSGRYDQWILTLTGGALGLTLGFCEKIVPEPVRWSIILLAVSWVALVFAMWAGLYSLFCSQYAIQKDIENEDAKYEALVAGGIGEVEVNPYRSKTDWLNRASIFSFTLGLAAFCVFAFVNLAKKQKFGSGDRTLNDQAQVKKI